MAQLQNPFENNIIVKLVQHRLGDNRKAKVTEVRAVVSRDVQQVGSGNVEQVNGKIRVVDERAMKLTKKLFKSPEYDRIVSLDGEIRQELSKLAVPTMLWEGTVLVPLALFARAQQAIDLYQAKRREAVNDLVSNWESIISQAEILLGPIFDPAQYPSRAQVQASFYVDVSYLDFTVSEKLKLVSGDLYELEREKFREQMLRASQEITLALREGLLKLVSHLQDRLRPDETTGKPKRLFDSAVTNLVEWMDLFASRNVTGDQELEILVQKAKRVLEGIAPEDLRSDGNLRSMVADRVKSIQESLDTLVTQAPGRKFDLSEESP